jgi:hypothetical protein
MTATTEFVVPRSMPMILLMGSSHLASHPALSRPFGLGRFVETARMIFVRV